MKVLSEDTKALYKKLLQLAGGDSFLVEGALRRCGGQSEEGANIYDVIEYILDYKREEVIRTADAVMMVNKRKGNITICGK